MPTARLLIHTSKKLAARVSEAMFSAGAEGLEERSGRGTMTLVAYAESSAALQALWGRASRLLSRELGTGQLPRATFEQDREERWRTAWMAHLAPVALTRHFALAPTSFDGALPHELARKEVLWYEPALAFGDGAHPTTRLLSRAIEAHYRARPGGALLDIGTGNGVLSIVALRSGARRAVGTDVAPEALAAASANASLNGVAARLRLVTPSARVAGSFDLAVANIELRPLLQVLAALPLAARRVPALLLSGFLTEQAVEVKRALAAAGFRARKRGGEAGWVLLEATSAPRAADLRGKLRR